MVIKPHLYEQGASVHYKWEELRAVGWECEDERLSLHRAPGSPQQSGGKSACSCDPGYFIWNRNLFKEEEHPQMASEAKTAGGKIERKTPIQRVPSSQESEYKSVKRIKM